MVSSPLPVTETRVCKALNWARLKTAPELMSISVRLKLANLEKSTVPPETSSLLKPVMELSAFRMILSSVSPK